MAGFNEIIGHETVIKQLKSQIETKRISHAYIFEGPNGSGKMMMAKAFAQTLLCEEGKDEPCHNCHTCKQAESESQPDIIFVKHEKPRTISVDDIRGQINQTIGIKPYSRPYKIYIVDEAEKMNEAAQNALLKTIEEPPEYAVLILLSSSSNKFLPTITSRCVTLSFRAVPDDEVKSFLIEKCNVDEDKADFAAAFAQGAPGKAMLLAQSEDFGEIRDSAVELLIRIGSKDGNEMDSYEMAQAIRRINEYHMELTDYLDILKVWYRDVLCFKATQNPNDLIFKVSDEVREIKEQANHISYGGLEEILNALEKAKIRLNANVNYDLTMELLLETIKENQK
ncbi:MAG: DNA polymerase III subunit delta' [Eubacterium sp.]|nr:DNA polymerase III subunit delta' [Eubacterium sp.]